MEVSVALDTLWLLKAVITLLEHVLVSKTGYTRKSSFICELRNSTKLSTKSQYIVQRVKERERAMPPRLKNIYIYLSSIGKKFFLDR